MITIYDRCINCLFPAEDLYPSEILYPMDPLILSNEMFDNNGLGVLRDFVSNPLITEVLNGDYTLEFDYMVGGWLQEYLTIDNFVKAPNNGNNQLFRIYYVDKSLNKVRVLARHIAFDLKDNFVEDVYPSNLDGQEVLDWILARTQYAHGFTAWSDVTSANTARYVRKNIDEVFFTADNSIISEWGGEFKFDNFVIKLYEQRGADNGVTIRYGKNIKGINATLDISDFATRIMPIGSNGLLLPELYVDSPLINLFHAPIIRLLNTDIDTNEFITEEEAYELMRQAALKEFIRLNPNLFTAKIDFVELSKVKEYEQYSDLESLELGDTVTIYVSQLDFNTTARVKKIVYDCFKERFIEMELA